MIFGAVPLDDAEGAVVAHSHRLGERMIRKGSVLDADAVAALRAAGRESVIAARLEASDVDEDASAARVAAALEAGGIVSGRAGTGRVNLHAETAGLLRVEAARIDAINGVDDALTVATLPDYAVVAARDMVATIKVIPFAVAGAVLARVEAEARRGAFALHPFRPLRVGLVVSELPGLKDSVVAGTIAATEARVRGLGGTLLPSLRCPHAEAPIAAALGQLLAAGAELLLVAGASATVDRRDVGPAGVVVAGGEIVHFGMPVDPGNLICVGRIGAVPALVLPGCARSPKLNGIDWVLARLFAGLPVGGPEIMRMGVGGLLKDTDHRPLPRAKANHISAGNMAAAAGGPVAAIVLAAGASTRMAPRHKLLVTDAEGRAMVARVVDNVLSSGARPVIVVIGHRSGEVRAALGGRPVTFVEAPDFALGLSASLRAGIAAVPDGVEAALVCLGDMPLVTGRVLDRLIAAHDRDEGRLVVVPTHRGRFGNPVLWDRRFFPEMMALGGDAGARALLKRHMEDVAEVELDEDSVLRDFDTPESLATLPARLRPVDAG